MGHEVEIAELAGSDETTGVQMDPEAGPSAISGCGLEPRERLVGIAHAPGPAAIEGVGADDDAGVECSCVPGKGRTFGATPAALGRAPGRGRGGRYGEHSGVADT